MGVRDQVWAWRVKRWVRHVEDAAPDPLPGVELRALVLTWNEADVIEWTVRNLFEQGAAAVHLVDNGSTDDTVARAAAAGATIEPAVVTEAFPQDLKPRVFGETIARLSAATDAEHLWWLHLDADELVEGPAGSTLADHLATAVDRRHRVVPSDTINHYPRVDAPLPPGADPRTVASNAQRREGGACRQRHWKHPLLRWDRSGPPLALSSGFHVVVDPPGRLSSPMDPIVTHHYPFRSKETTMARLEELAPRVLTEPWAMGRRLRNVGAIYREAYAEVDPHDMVGPGQRFDPRPRAVVRPPGGDVSGG